MTYKQTALGLKTMANYKKPEDRKWSYTFYVGEDLRALIAKEAEKKSRTKSEIIRNCIEKYFGVKRK